MTVILATHRARVSGLTPEELRYADLGDYASKSPLAYRENGRAIASVVLIWPGWVATVAR